MSDKSLLKFAGNFSVYILFFMLNYKITMESFGAIFLDTTNGSKTRDCTRNNF